MRIARYSMEANEVTNFARVEGNEFSLVPCKIVSEIIATFGTDKQLDFRD